MSKCVNERAKAPQAKASKSFSLFVVLFLALLLKGRPPPAWPETKVIRLFGRCICARGQTLGVKRNLFETSSGRSNSEQ